MNRRDSVAALLALGAAMGTRTAFAQAAAPRVVLVLTGTVRTQSDRVDAFRQRLSELGYVEGRNLTMEMRELEGQFDRLPKLMGEIVQATPKVIVTSWSESVRAAMAATSSIAIVTVTVGYPVEQGFAASLARPGKNVTGNALLDEVMFAKAVQVLHEMVPRATRVAFLVDPANLNYALHRKTQQEAAEKRGLSAIFALASSLKEMPKAFADVATQRADLLVVANHPLLVANPKIIVDLAARHRFPAIYPNSSFMADGGLVLYGYDILDLYRNAAVFVDRILKGAKPADIPFEQPTRFEMVINLKTAKTLGIKIPQSVLIRADRVLE